MAVRTPAKTGRNDRKRPRHETLGLSLDDVKLMYRQMLLNARDRRADDAAEPDGPRAVYGGVRLCLDALREVATLGRHDVPNELVAGAAAAPDTRPELRRDAGGRLVDSAHAARSSRKRHTQHDGPDGSLYAEELFGLEALPHRRKANQAESD